MLQSLIHCHGEEHLGCQPASTQVPPFAALKGQSYQAKHGFGGCIHFHKMVVFLSQGVGTPCAQAMTRILPYPGKKGCHLAGSVHHQGLGVVPTLAEEAACWGCL